MARRTHASAWIDRLSDLRVDLTGALFLDNPTLAPEALNEAARSLLDGLLVVRVCEDRDIVPAGALRSLLDFQDRGAITSLREGLSALFVRLGQEIGEELFRPPLSPDVTVDEGALRHVLEQLCSPRDPSVPRLPVTILGAAYERSLGAALFPGGDGLEAGARDGAPRSSGVVYTPDWIVREIVHRVLGPRLAGLGSGDLLRLRVLDPACGAGSFLLGAAEALFEAHLDWHRRSGAPPGDGLFVTREGALQLTAQARAEIVLRCLFGVDKDPRAILVAKQSLAIAVLDGAPRPGMDQKRSTLSTSHFWPALERNLRCGNSLIAPSDIPPEMGFEAARRLCPFDWDDMDTGFGRITREGGFHAIVGNPPYIRIQEAVQSAPDEVPVLRRAYPGATDGGFDIYAAFVQKSLRLLREDGALGFILPLRWMKAHYGRELRSLVARNGHLAEVDDFGPEQVFAGVSTYTGLHIFSAGRSESVRYRRIAGGSEERGLGAVLSQHHIATRDLGEGPFYLGHPPELRGLFQRLLACEVTLESAADRISQGLKTGCDGVFVLHDVERDGARLRGRSKTGNDWVEIEAAACKGLVKSAEMQRYRLLPPKRALIFPYEIDVHGKAALLPFLELSARFPKTAAYLHKHRGALHRRERGRLSARSDFHQYSRHQNLDLPGLPKIVVADVLDRARFTCDEAGSVAFLGGAAGGYGIVLRPLHDPFLVTAVLNSTLCEWMLRPPGLSDWFSGGWFSGEARFIKALPMLPPSAAEAPKIAALSRQLHSLYPDASPKSDPREPPDGSIAEHEAAIDALVFEAFGVTSTERHAIESLVRHLRIEYGRRDAA